jgi:hypothetical protein
LVTQIIHTEPVIGFNFLISKPLFFADQKKIALSLKLSEARLELIQQFYSFGLVICELNKISESTVSTLISG